MSKILLTNGAYKQTLALVRVLGAAGYAVGVVGHRRWCVSFFSKYCHQSHVIASKCDAQKYVTELLTIIEKEKYTVLLPVGYPETGWINDHAAALKPYIKIPLPPLESLKIFENKAKTHEFAQKLRIPVPKTFAPQTHEEAAVCLKNLHFPIVFKNLQEGNNRLAYAHSEADFWTLFQDFSNQKQIQKNANTEGVEPLKIKNLEIKNTSNPSQKPLIPHRQSPLFVVQEFLTGEGIGFFARYEKGAIQQSYQHRRLREYPVSGGAACFAETIENQQIRNYGEQILAAAHWHGVAMVEFKLDGQGEPHLLEVNPKFWGSYDLCVAAETDFVVPLVRQILGESPPSVKKPKLGVRFSWLMNGDGQHGIETDSFWRVLKDFFNPKIQSNLTGNDPWASLFLIGLGSVFLIKSCIKRVFTTQTHSHLDR